MIEDRRPRKKDVPAKIVCFNCGEKGHKSNACSGEVKRCFRCGKKGHALAEGKHNDIVCFNCNEEGHIGSQCKQPKKAPTTSRVFALTGTQTENEDCLIRVAVSATYSSLLMRNQPAERSWKQLAEKYQ
ncbi:zinc finger protein GIS2-like [Medicago truncatula]|uniref:zinc finger protein GIS2-like n=1 Tax=Medicago truncatula TaxID=3880 RepID=UPI0019673068|nr:zinc finger protein GIS2-like [Medicago truncatula]